MTDILSVLDSINKVAEVGMKSGQEVRQAEIDALVSMLIDARNQIEYMQEKFTPTSTGVATISRIDALLSRYPVPR
jgi:hypothetical protein